MQMAQHVQNHESLRISKELQVTTVWMHLKRVVIDVRGSDKPSSTIYEVFRLYSVGNGGNNRGFHR